MPKYSILDYGALSVLIVLALPSPEDAVTLGATNIIGVVGIKMFYPEVWKMIPVIGDI